MRWLFALNVANKWTKRLAVVVAYQFFSLFGFASAARVGFEYISSELTAEALSAYGTVVWYLFT